MLMPPSVAETDPPTQVVAPLAGVARKSPAGRDAEKETEVASVVEAVLSTVQTSCPVPPSTIVPGTNWPLNKGGASTTLNELEVAWPLFPSLEVRSPLVTA
jgi:hypothetical protein